MKIALLTGGGDCPGLNSVIRSVVQTATLQYDYEVIGIRNGFKGVLEADYMPLNLSNTNDIFSRGGTMLGSSNIDTPFRVPVWRDGKKAFEDQSEKAISNLRELGADALIVVGGDGTQAISHGMAEKCGCKVVGIPKTIDNDLAGTEVTIGFNTAVDTAVEAIDKLQTTAESHSRVMVVEVMGRYAGWISLFAGLGSDADVVLIPEIPFNLDKVVERITNSKLSTKPYSIVVVAEGALPVGGQMTVQKIVEDSPEQIRLGGVAHNVAADIEMATGRTVRAIVLGHLLRGGGPVAFDRILASRMGEAAVRAVAEKNFDKMVAYNNQKIELVPLGVGAGKNRFVGMDSPFLLMAKSKGVSFGD